MKKSTNYFARAAMMLLLVLLASMTVRAHEQQVIVWLSDGTKSAAPFSTMPEFTYADGYVKMKSTNTEQSWPIEKLSKLTFIKKGDVNEDGVVNQKDIQEVKDYIMASPSGKDDKSKLDVNGDNQVNVADIVEITNIIQSVVTSAQSIIVEGKNKKQTIYNSEEVTSLDFQKSPAGFTVRRGDIDTFYSFDDVQGIKCLPDYLFVDPKVVHVSLASAEGYEAMFAAEVKTNVEYDVKTSDPWIKVARKEADRLVCNVLQHQGNDRKGYVALASKDGLLTDTIKVYLNDEFYVLKCLTPLQSITTVGTAKFMLIEIVNGALRPAAGKTISFSAENGTCSVKEAVTDAQGMVSVDFIPNSESIDRGSVQASFRGRINGISMMYTSTALFALEVFELRCQPKQYFWKDGAVTVEFQLVKYDKGTRKPVRAIDINFTCENGTLNAQSKQTDEEGKVTVDFALDKNFKTGSVTARCKVQLIGGSYWFGGATTEVIKGEEYMLEALTPEIHLCGDNFGEIPVQFRLLKYDFEKYEWEPSGDKTIKFTAVNGVAGSTSAVSDVDGIVTVTFQPDQGFVEGSLTASCDIDLPDGNKWHGEAVTKFMTDLYKIERILPWNADAVDYYIGKPWDCEFQLLKKEGNGYVPCPYQYIQFEATNGSCTPDYALTDAEGKVQATYTMDDDKDNGSLKASFSFTDAEGNVCIGSVTTNFFLDKYDLKCLTPEVEVKQSEIVEIRFQLFEYKGRGKWEPCPDKTITFTAKNGICTPEWTKTNAEGIATVRFSPTSTDVTEGVVQAECGITLDPKTGLEWRAAELALITITESYKLECLTKEVEIKKGETADIRFRLMEFEEGKWVTCSGVVNFTAENGTSNPEWMQADDDGLTHATFIPAADATEGTLTGSISIIINDKAKMTWSDVAHITIIDDGGGSTPCDTGDELLNKADQQDNTYVIKNKKTGETMTRSYAPKWSEWNKDKDFISFSLEDADANGGTLGMAWGHIPLTMSGVVLALTGQTFENTPGGKFGLDVYEGTEISADFACFTGESGMTTMGNIKPESKIMLREPCNKKAGTRGNDYTGEYEILFYLVFQNQTWNNETQQMELGDEYEVYGKGTMKMHVPTITSMQLSSESQYLKVGESTKVKVDQYYEEGAQWDWSDVQIAGQSADYSSAYDGADEGFFTWDPATQTLTSVKPNDNKSVYVVFSLKSKPSVKSAFTIATGEGWKYTMIKVGPEEQEVSPGYGCSFYIEDFAPRENEDEKFDDSAIEIDPESDPDGNFRYVHYNGRYSASLYVYRSDAAPGEYNIRFRLKSNHDIGCTMKIIIKPEE